MVGTVIPNQLANLMGDKPGNGNQRGTHAQGHMHAADHTVSGENRDNTQKSVAIFLVNIAVGKVNTDENMSLSSQFQITSIPCLIIFKGGKAINKMVGFRPKNAIEQELNNVL